MSAKYVGVHMPTGKGLDAAVREANAMGCTAVQLFTSSPRMWKSRPLSEEQIENFRRAVSETGIDRLLSHDTYLVNLCHADPTVAAKSRQALSEEIGRCHQLGIGLVVSHMGSLLARPAEEGYAMVAQHTAILLDEIPPGVTLCMETTAGQGSVINSRFEEIADLLDRCGRHPQLGVCLDSCHVFAAGYDIATRDAFDVMLDEFDRVIGLSALKAIHLNDSKKCLGSRVDRHEGLGRGQIGEDAFRFFATEPRLSHIPMVIETPMEDGGHHRDLSLLLGFVNAASSK